MFTFSPLGGGAVRKRAGSGGMVERFGVVPLQW